MGARTTEALIERALRAWLACGLPVASVEVTEGGVVRILAGPQEPRLPSADTDQDEERCAAAFGAAR